MEYKISSGNGPAECELAITKFHTYLVKKYAVTTLNTSDGYNKDTFRSVTIETAEDLSEYVGSILWICKSPYRQGHKRKNWFINFLPCNSFNKVEFEEAKVRFETFRSGGNGGQHVNKTESGIRAIYIPTGDSTVCTDERSHFANKKKALAQLRNIISEKNKSGTMTASNNTRIEGVQIERGNASATFEGMNFKRIL